MLLKITKYHGHIMAKDGTPIGTIIEDELLILNLKCQRAMLDNKVGAIAIEKVFSDYQCYRGQETTNQSIVLQTMGSRAALRAGGWLAQAKGRSAKGGAA